MNFQQIVRKLEEEIKGENRKYLINEYETNLSKEIEKLSNNEEIFNLPLNNIFSVISQVNFQETEDEHDKIIEYIHNIIRNINKTHFEEKETILILQNINIKTNSFTFEEIFSFLELITNCPLLVHFCDLYHEQNQAVDIDYEYEIKEKDQEIEKLKNEINHNYQQHKNLINFAQITEKPKDFEPYIFKACMDGKLESVQWLIEIENEDKFLKVENSPNFRPPSHINGNDTPIHTATQYGHLPIVQYLVDKQNVDPNIQGYRKRTPLHIACEFNHLNIVDYLLSRGVNTEARDVCGQTPFWVAYIKCHKQIMDYVISKYHLPSDYKPLLYSELKEKPKDFEYEPNIFKACKLGKLTSVQWLIEKENVDKYKRVEENDRISDIHLRTLFIGDTPIHIAIRSGHLPIVQYLIEEQNVDIEIKGHLDMTPLHMACCSWDPPFVEYLLSKGANIEAKNKDDNTALHIASSYGCYLIVQFLLSKGANKNAINKDGKTPKDVARNADVRNILN